MECPSTKKHYALPPYFKCRKPLAVPLLSIAVASRDLMLFLFYLVLCVQTFSIYNECNRCLSFYSRGNGPFQGHLAIIILVTANCRKLPAMAVAHVAARVRVVFPGNDRYCGGTQGVSGEVLRFNCGKIFPDTRTQGCGMS